MAESPDELQGIDISEDEFQAAVSPPDLKGRINLRIEQALQQEIENIAEDSRYPMRSVSEVVRYCCLLGLERLRQWRPGPTLLGSIRAANQLLIHDKLQCESVELIQRLEERIEWYIQNGFYDEVIDLTASVQAHFQGIPDSFWKQFILRELDTRFVVWLDRIDQARTTTARSDV